MAPQPPIHPWRRPLFRGLGARSSVTGSVFPTDMGYIGASEFASEKYFHRPAPAPALTLDSWGLWAPQPPALVNGRSSVPSSAGTSVPATSQSAFSFDAIHSCP